MSIDNNRKNKNNSEDAHYVYLLLCKDNTLYCGYTNNLIKRINTHNSGKGARYTKCRLPVKLIYYESFSSKSSALKREIKIKKFSKKEKLKLIQQRNDLL